jgi:hypothetical protein
MNETGESPNMTARLKVIANRKELAISILEWPQSRYLSAKIGLRAAHLTGKCHTSFRMEPEL